MTSKAIHQGRNVKRFREMLGIKQEALADSLGEDWNQKKVSLLEGKEEIDDDTLELVAGVLKVPVKAIENFDEEAAITYINTFNESTISHGQFNVLGDQINPVEKWLEALNENKRLYEELLKSEREKVVMLERMMENK
jgi:transcriptional regulator with XRE-family HTH domain